MAENDKKDPAGVTIYEIARQVGVSPAAVSSVLTNRHVERRIAPGTAQRILEAARKMGYVPNMAGRRLRAHKAATRQFDIAILTAFEAPLPLVGQALHALQQEVDARTDDETSYAVAIEMFHAGRLGEKPGLLNANRYHGVILTNTLPADDAFLEQALLPYAVVVLGRNIHGYCCVLEEPDAVGTRAAEVLLRAGCRKPVVLHGRRLTQATADRARAFVRTIQAALGVEPLLVAAADLSPAGGVTALEEFIAAGGVCDGLFCVTDSLALGAYQALRRAGRRIPEDVAVVGVGDHEIAEYFDPPLATVAGSNEAMVAQAVPLLFKMLEGASAQPGATFVVPPLCVRASALPR